jgi:predicted metal-dependent peptidase
MSMKIINNTITSLISKTDYDHIGYILQCMNIRQSEQLPTAGVNYDSKAKKFNLYFNAKFMESLKPLEQQAVLIHEIDHILHGHVFMNIKKEDMKTWNMAMDLVINQGNTHIPDMALKIEKFRHKDGTLFEANKASEYYYYSLKSNGAEMQVPKQGEKGEGQGEDSEQQGSSAGPQQGEGEQEWVKVSDYMKDREQGTFDSHDWEAMNEADKKEVLDALKDVIKTARKKTSDYGKGARTLDEKLEEINKDIKSLDYKSVIRTALKRSLPASNFSRSYNRPNRRLGVKSAGKVVEILPKITFLMDTSGSIDIDQANEFLSVVDEFMGIVSKAELHFFHTETYKTMKVTKGTRIKQTDIESGGTDLTNSFSKIIKERSDLVVVLTDGYFGMPEVNVNRLPKTVFILNKEGNVNHPMASKCKTYFYKAD